MIRLVSGALWALLWMAAGSHAASEEVAPVPEADFLEFLGSWQTGDNRWIDPFRAADLSGSQAGLPQKLGRSTEGKGLPRIKPRENRQEQDQKGSRTSDSVNEMQP